MGLYAQFLHPPELRTEERTEEFALVGRQRSNAHVLPLEVSAHTLMIPEPPSICVGPAMSNVSLGGLLWDEPCLEQGGPPPNPARCVLR